MKLEFVNKHSLNVVGLSGGGLKGIGHLGVLKQLDNLYFEADVVGGISVGSVIALPYLLGKLDMGIDRMLSMTINDFFDKPPLNKKGNFTIPSTIRGLTSPAAGRQKMALIRLINELVTYDEFYHFKYDSTFQNKDVLIGATNRFTKRIEYVWVKDLSYEEYLLWVAASSAIPIATLPVEIGNNEYWDGGLIDHNPTGALIDRLGDKIGNLKSVYTRPFEVTENRTKLKNIVHSALAAFDIFVDNTSREDEVREWEEVGDLKIPNYAIYHLPSILESPYDDDPDRLGELYRKGYQLKPTRTI